MVLENGKFLPMEMEDSFLVHVDSQGRKTSLLILSKRSKGLGGDWPEFAVRVGFSLSRIPPLTPDSEYFY